MQEILRLSAAPGLHFNILGAWSGGLTPVDLFSSHWGVSAIWTLCFVLGTGSH